MKGSRGFMRDTARGQDWDKPWTRQQGVKGKGLERLQALACNKTAETNRGKTAVATATGPSGVFDTRPAQRRLQRRVADYSR